MNWLKNYKEKDCKTKIGKFFQHLVFNTYYKIIAASVLVMIGAIAFNFTKEGGFWDGLASTIYGIGLITLVIITVIAIVYAWIINPIRALVQKIKEMNKKKGGN